MKNYPGACSSDPKQLLMELQSLFSKGSIEKSDLQNSLAFQSTESGRDEPAVCHVTELVDTPVSSESDTYQDNEHKGLLQPSHMKDWVMSTQFDLSYDGHHIGRDIVPEEVLCDEKENRKSMPTSDSNILHENLHFDKHAIRVLDRGVAVVQALETSTSANEQLKPELKGEKAETHCEKVTSTVPGAGSVMNMMSLSRKDGHTVYYQEQDVPNDLSGFISAEEPAACEDGSVFGSGIVQSCGQKHIDEINSKLSSCDTEVLHQDHKEECTIPSEDEVTQEVPETERVIMLLSVAGMPEIPDKQLNSKLVSHEAEECSFSCDKDTNDNLYTGSMKNDQLHLPEECHIVSWQKQEVPNDLSVPRRPEESANCQDDRVSESGPCQTSGQQCRNESSSMQATSNIEAFNQDHEDNNANNEGQITPGITAGSMQATSNIEAFNQDHEDNNANNEGQITPGITAGSVSEAADIERSERETGLTAAAGTSVLPVEQLNTEVEGNLVDEHCCSYGKGTLNLFDMESLNIKASSLHKDTRMDPSVEENPPNDLSAPRSPEESTVFQNNSVPGSAGICQSSRRRGIDELRAKLQSFKVSSTVKGSYIAMSAPRPKQSNNLSQSAIRMLRNMENTPAIKDTHMDPSVEENPPNDLSAPRSPEESTVFENNSVPGSAGICQSSRRRGIDELHAKLQSFKVSRTVKGSYIAMSAPRPKQGDNLGQSAITMLRNRENTPAVKPHLAKPDPDRSVAKDSSRRALQPISGRPRDH